MKITRIETYPVLIPLKPERRMISALGEHIESKYVIVRIETDAGIEGVGEATVMPRWSGETVWGTKALIDRVFAPLLVGCDPNDIETIDRTMDKAAACNWFTKAAIEMACWDIQGKAAGKPVYELLGGAVRPLSIRCRFSMGAYPPERARRRAEELVAEGFTTIKVKVGTVPDEDIERVRIVREAIGPDREIVIDANTGWDAPTAIAAMKEMAQYRIAVFEQPTTNGDYAALAEVRRALRSGAVSLRETGPQAAESVVGATGEPAAHHAERDGYNGGDTKVMADDIVFDLIHAKECIRNEACDVISLYPGKNGGIRKTKEIIDYAAQHGVACSIGSNLEWDIATAAMCHVVVACPNMQVETYPGDILGPEYHEFRIAKNPVAIEGPIVSITDRPGLGVEVDWDMVERARIED